MTKEVFVCSMRKTDMSVLLYKRLHADSLIEMHVCPKQ